MSRGEAEATCGAWENQNGIIPITDLNQQRLDDIDVFEFYGIVQRPGEVCPVNIDHCVFYTEQPIQHAPPLPGTPLRIDHVSQIEDEVAPPIGQTSGQAILEANLFGKFEIHRAMWERFVNFAENHNALIELTYNELIQRISNGELALSAGLSVATMPTTVHQYTVREIVDWDEVSIVGAPASPGSWAFACEGSCRIIFGQNMTDKLEVDLETLREAAEEDETSIPPQLLEIAESADGLYRSTSEGVELVREEDELTQSCGCSEPTDTEQEVEELRDELQQVRDERDTLKAALDEVRQERLQDAEQKLREVNETLPEDEQYSEEELEQFVENADNVSHLEQTIDMIERVASTAEQSAAVEEPEEDLGGTSQPGSNQELEQAQEEVDSVVQDLLGRESAEQLFEEIESGTFGE